MKTLDRRSYLHPCDAVLRSVRERTLPRHLERLVAYAWRSLGSPALPAPRVTQAIYLGCYRI